MLPEIELNVEATVISATNRKLKAVWTVEAAEDVRAFQGLHGVELDDLCDKLADEVQAEIDREILNDLRSCAGLGPEDGGGVRRKRKKTVQARPITDEWEVSRWD